MGRRFPSARRSRLWNSSAITPTRRNFCNGCTPSAARLKQTYLVHGEPSAASQLRDAMTEALGWNVQVAAYRQKVQVE